MQRLALLESIARDGYHPERGKTILGVRRGEEVWLRGGHHRAAALSVLGHERLPGVALFSPGTLRLLKRASVV
jgi:hypothetical protein